MSLVQDTAHIRLGMIGMTEGNGHPYSWSAMFNKFDRVRMPAECPFPVIPVYLARENYETMGIPGASVECIWSMNSCCSRKEFPTCWNFPKTKSKRFSMEMRKRHAGIETMKK